MNIPDQIERAGAFSKYKFAEVHLENHYLEVYDILKNEFGIDDPDVLTAALLHDTLEDTNTTYGELAQAFSPAVADYVAEVSHPKNYAGHQKDEYYEKLNSVSLGAKQIKYGDFTSHLRKFIAAFHGEGDYPKMTHNQYVQWIQTFLEHAPDSNVKDYIYSLTVELDDLIRHENTRGS